MTSYIISLLIRAQQIYGVLRNSNSWTECNVLRLVILWFSDCAFLADWTEIKDWIILKEQNLI